MITSQSIGDKLEAYANSRYCVIQSAANELLAIERMARELDDNPVLRNGMSPDAKTLVLFMFDRLVTKITSVLDDAEEEAENLTDDKTTAEEERDELKEKVEGMASDIRRMLETLT